MFWMSRNRSGSAPRHRVRRLLALWLLVLLVAWIAVGTYHGNKALPPGMSVAKPMQSVEQLGFLADYSYVDPSGRRHVDQRIFDRILELIEGAERLVVMDMFLFNDFAGDVKGPNMRALSTEVANALIKKKRGSPEMPVILITDPINTLYGSLDVELLERMRQAGVEVVMTRLRPLRDSNPAWSGVWRICCQWFGNSSSGGWLPNPVGDQKVTLRGVLGMLNFKANHRKTLVVDAGDDWVGLVTSGNPHDASSAHSNIAIEFSGAAALDLLETERAVVAFSAPDLQWPDAAGLVGQKAGDRDPSLAPFAKLQVLTEAEIRQAVLTALALAEPGDLVDLAMFYFAHRDIMRALKVAHLRGVRLRVLMDPNKGAFGRKKSGVPNRPVGWELHDAGIPVRWCDTHGEQCHDKLVLVRAKNGRAELIAGSANYTRRNLDDFNLETNVRLVADPGHRAIADAAAYFERRWNNRPGQSYSVPYEHYADQGRLRYWQYRFMEFTGLSTF
ncbi:MAG: phospholipase D family protein [Xanthomonadaceae bacterium]|nr:phospholipase D family protein [Xanthomonadaceae bacterium]